MRELLYCEVPTPNPAEVVSWLQNQWQPVLGSKFPTEQGLRLQGSSGQKSELSIFVWSLQRTTYLKCVRWGEQSFPQEMAIAKQLQKALEQVFPTHYPVPPAINLEEQNIFQALETYYPETVKFFQKLPQGEYDLKRVYWWEKRWRESVADPQTPKQVIYQENSPVKVDSEIPHFDLIYIGGALGSVHGAVMARLGYKVLLLERLPFGRMNREWNISRDEFQRLIDLNLFTPEEFESIIAREYRDGFNKFFDAYNPPHLKANVLHTPNVLNVALNSGKFLELCGQKLRSAGGTIWDETEFVQGTIDPEKVVIDCVDLSNGESKQAQARLLIDAMGTASPIAWQLNGGKTFNSVCPTVGAVVEGIDPVVWDNAYGDVLNSHGDISRGRQLIWELFPGAGDEMTIYLFHYHQVHPNNPGSLLEMYEDFFTILPEYRRCNLDKLTWKKATFGYIPGHFSTSAQDRTIALDRLMAIGDAASLQSPLVFTGFGSLVRNLSKLTDLLHTALQYDFLKASQLNQIRAYQSNIAVTWLFSKGMMVPTGKQLPPERVNSMLNTFFGLLADSSPDVAETFIKDRTTWLLFSRLALKAASKNPQLLLWIWEMAGTADLLKWLLVYFDFSRQSLLNAVFRFWYPQWLLNSRSWLENFSPQLWFSLLCFGYQIQPKLVREVK